MKKGFTLIELLAVIIILALLVILVFPSIINYVRDSSKKTDELTLKLIYDAADTYIAKNKNDFSKNNGNEFSIDLKTLVDDGFLSSPVRLSGNDSDITDKKCIQVSYNNGFTYQLKDIGDCNEFVINVRLPQGLTPVIYKDGDWEIADTSKKWYDYKNQEWANAVILNKGVSKIPGTKIYPQTYNGKVTNIKAMFVYIPRFSYTIGNTYGVQLTGGNIPSQATPGAIDIKFVSRKTKEDGEAIYTGNKPSEWYTHPAFTFGEQELEGIWVGKFELSHTTLSSSITENNLNCTNGVCDENIVDNLRILPGVVSLRYNKVSNFFYTIEKMSRDKNSFGIGNVDSHMIKNSEWGAVAYLSQSKYGKYGNPEYEGLNKEIYVNNSPKNITGSSNGTPSTETYRDSSGGQTATESTTSQCTYMNTTDNCGVGASTTGNITGIYDMNGGSLEFTMAYFEYGNSYWGEPYAHSNGVDFTEKPENKYFDEYTAFGKNDRGHALSELGTGSKSWYNDITGFIIDSFPWMLRSYGGLEGGIFSYAYHNGGVDQNVSTRVVLAHNS